MSSVSFPILLCAITYATTIKIFNTQTGNMSPARNRFWLSSRRRRPHRRFEFVIFIIHFLLFTTFHILIDCCLSITVQAVLAGALCSRIFLLSHHSCLIRCYSPLPGFIPGSAAPAPSYRGGVCGRWWKLKTWCKGSKSELPLRHDTRAAHSRRGYPHYAKLPNQCVIDVRPGGTKALDWCGTPKRK